MAAPPANTGITWGRDGGDGGERGTVGTHVWELVTHLNKKSQSATACSRFEGYALALSEVNMLAIVYVSRCSLFATHNAGREKEVDGHGAGEELDAREERQG